LRAWLELGRWVGRLFGLFGWHLPGRVGRLDLPELLGGFILGVGRKRMFELLGGNLPGRHGCFKLRRLWRGKGIELDWGVGVEHLRALLGGLLFIVIGGRCLCGLRRRERCARCGGFKLYALHRRPIRGGDGFVGVRCVPRRPVPNGHGCDGLCELPGRSVRDHARRKQQCLLELLCWPVPDDLGGVDLH